MNVACLCGNLYFPFWCMLLCVREFIFSLPSLFIYEAYFFPESAAACL